jgi:hypothetical protein
MASIPDICRIPRELQVSLLIRERNRKRVLRA